MTPKALALSLLLATLPLSAGAQTVPETLEQVQLSFAPVVKAAAPAVVNIYATRVVAAQDSPFAGDPVFERFFQQFGTAQPQVQNSLGSGVILAADGIVVTNYHVVGQATEIRVVLNDRREFAATVMLGDEEADLAVLRLQDASGLPVLPIRNSDEVQVGDLVLAIGNPFGVGQTVSSGIVSGLARSSLQVGQGRGYFIQTDAAINPGNSGGALVDTAGRLVGINTAILTRDGGSNGIGFAIPSNLVSSVVAQAQAGATAFARPWAGLSGQGMDAALAESLGMDRPDGVLVSDLHPASPFAAVGIKPGDVILTVDGAATNTPQEMMFRLAARGVGADAAVTWFADGAVNEGRVALIAPPDDPPADPQTVSDRVPLRGLTVARINPAQIAAYDLPLMAQGVVVTDVQDYAAGSGLQPGDILLAVNGESVAVPEDVLDLAQMQTRVWVVDVVRQGQALRLRFRI
ncbi:MAG: serine protease [Rhodobacteraceae bacterium PARR1]|nr:MAG: serine protease [Rhodobacteraceae bacterium PARR1]